MTATLADLNPSVLVCGGGQSRWRDEDLLAPWTRSGERARIVLATMQTASTAEFRSGIRQGEHLFLVADEVHRLGSAEHQKLFTLQTGPRLGLSATPRRAGDPIGTDAIFTYFNGVVPPRSTPGAERFRRIGSVFRLHELWRSSPRQLRQPVA